MANELHLVYFVAYCNTRVGQTAYLCGSTKELGEWHPQQGIRLYTDRTIYPRWESFTHKALSFHLLVEFKLCFVHSSGTHRWENLSRNRVLMLDRDSRIQISEGQRDINIVDRENQHEHCTKKTWQIIQSLDSDEDQSDQSPCRYKIIDHRYNDERAKHMSLVKLPRSFKKIVSF